MLADDLTMKGLLLNAAGLGALHRAWTRPERDWRWIAAGWSALALATVAGPRSDRGVALGLLVLSLAAYGLVAVGADRRPGKRPRMPPERPRPPWSFPWRGLARAVLAGPVGALAGLAATVPVLRHGAGSADDRLVAAGLAAPLAWSVAMAWSLGDRRLWRPALGLAAFAAAGLVS